MAPTTYSLPDLSRAVLLGHDTRPGEVIAVYPAALRQHDAHVVRGAERFDLVIRQVEPPPASAWA